MRIITKLVSSLEKIFPDEAPGNRLERASALCNEPFSFQVAYRCEPCRDGFEPFYVRVQTDLEDRLISQYSVGYVPVMRADFMFADENFDRKTPGLYPDMLLRRTTNAPLFIDDNCWKKYVEDGENNILSAVSDSYQALWFTVNEDRDTLEPGSYEITVKFFSSRDNELLAEETLTLHIIEAKLPKQSLYYTSWFHNDCLADTYNLEVFSDEYFTVMRSFVREAAKTGMNMILLPAFTPALDTPIGGERKTVQLVKVARQGDRYTFDFSLMKKYIGISLIVLGALLLILCAFVPFMGDLADQNWYTWGSFIVLIVGGLITHIIVNKKLEAE
ncbi:MAG: hypothetical protein J5662_06765 [Clostridia bacterium]|nr:hypothetical protein [Clostridia bacterium]